MAKNLPWQGASLADNEEKRLDELRTYHILDTPPEAVFDRLTRMAARRFDMPIALVSLIDRNRQWFKSRYGLDAQETPRDVAFCAHVILQDEVMVINDTATDPRFAGNPLVTGSPNIRFYAGAPLITGHGYHLGTVCVIDRVPHPDFSEEQKKELAELALIAMDEMELRLAIKRVHEDLETIKSTQHALDLAHEKAEKVIQDKTQFIANISHELRTPMNGILGMVYLLGDTRLDAVQREYVETINHSAQNLLLLVNDVLDVSKIEAGELILEQASFDVKTSFSQTIKLLKPLADKKEIRLFCHVDYGIPDRIVGDPGRFAQIVTNLVGNAVKFTDSGSVNAYLHYDTARNQIFCEVKDTGIGIPENMHSAIFEKFVQGDAVITQKYGGTGLGLTITKQLVTMLGGEIGFESKVKEGSRFWFTLPVNLPDEAHRLPDRACVSTTDALCIPVQSACVLVAEDHPVNQLFLVKILKKFGFVTIDVADNGAAVMEKIYTREKAGDAPYDIIFMDCKMPEIDGYEATKLIRKDEAENKKHTIIIAMTANALAGDREICFEAGMDEYLTKPLQPERLKEILRNWFVFAGVAPTAGAIRPVRGDLPPLDVERLAIIAQTGEERAEVMALFFRTADEIVATLENSRRDRELTQWKAAAHNLKGSAANLGMHQLCELCKLAEHGDTHHYAQRSDIIADIKDELQNIRNFVGERHANSHA